MREWVGQRQIQSMQAQGTSITNKKFESTVGIPREDIEDDQVGLYTPMMELAGQSAAELPDDEVFSLLKKVNLRCVMTVRTSSTQITRYLKSRWYG